MVKTFTIVHNDGAVKVVIEDDGHTIIDVDQIQDQEVIVRAIIRAYREGARFGTLFTGDVVNDRIARMHLLRAAKGNTWLGGKVTRLADGEDGPTFRIDWDEFPRITDKGE